MSPVALVRGRRMTMAVPRLRFLRPLHALRDRGNAGKVMLQQSNLILFALLTTAAVFRLVLVAEHAFVRVLMGVSVLVLAMVVLHAWLIFLAIDDHVNFDRR